MDATSFIAYCLSLPLPPAGTSIYPLCSSPLTLKLYLLFKTAAFVSVLKLTLFGKIFFYVC